MLSKVKQVCLEAIYRGDRDVQCCLLNHWKKEESHSYFNCGRRAAQFYPVVIVVSLLNALDQIDEKKTRERL